MRSHVLALVVGAALLSGCASWEPTRVSPRVLLSETRAPDEIRLSIRERPQPVLVTAPRLEGDTIFGADPRYLHVPVQRFALSDVQEIAVRRSNGSRTLVAGLIAAVGAATVVYFIARSHESEDWDLQWKCPLGC